MSLFDKILHRGEAPAPQSVEPVAAEAIAPTLEATPVATDTIAPAPEVAPAADSAVAAELGAQADTLAAMATADEQVTGSPDIAVPTPDTVPTVAQQVAELDAAQAAPAIETFAVPVAGEEVAPAPEVPVANPDASADPASTDLWKELDPNNVTAPAPSTPEQNQS